LMPSALARATRSSDTVTFNGFLTPKKHAHTGCARQESPRLPARRSSAARPGGAPEPALTSPAAEARCRASPRRKSCHRRAASCAALGVHRRARKRAGPQRSDITSARDLDRGPSGQVGQFPNGVSIRASITLGLESPCFNGAAASSRRRGVPQDPSPEYGPFRLAFLETLVRVADWRASARHAARVAHNGGRHGCLN
jgi:hypothetical protein